jgi:hypothetical protein
MTYFFVPVRGGGEGATLWAYLYTGVFRCLEIVCFQRGSQRLVLSFQKPLKCNQIKIMPFIQTFLAQSESASPKATTLHVYNMSLFLVACLLSRWQRASSARCLQTKARGLTTPRSSKPPSPDSADVIAGRDRGEPAVCTAPALLQASLPRLHGSDCVGD